MREMHYSDKYTLSLRDFGPIATADLEMRPMTVLVGPSDTGKSYVTKLIYALHQAFARSSIAPPGFTPQSLRVWHCDSEIVEQARNDPEAIHCLVEWVNSFVADRDAPLPAILLEHFYPMFENLVPFNELLEQMICRCFSASIDDLIRRNVNVDHATVEIVCPSSESGSQDPTYRAVLQHEPPFVGEFTKLHSYSPRIVRNATFKSVLKRLLVPVPTQEQLRNTIGVLLQGIADLLFRSWFLPLNRTAHYLPASRSSLIRIHPALLSSLVQHVTSPDRSTTSNSQLFSGITGDFIRQLIQMTVPSVQAQNPNLTMEAKRVENRILGGQVHARQLPSNLTSYLYQPRDWNNNLSMEQSSSMVAELAPLVLYLRYVVRSGDLLIIEEPESHLHPSGQALLAGELARLISYDVHVIVTTHSDWILEKFANLVRQSGLSIEGNLDSSSVQRAVPREEFGAWLFRKSDHNQASEVVEVPLEEDAGGFDVGYEETADALYNEWARIGDRLALGETK